MKQKFPQQRSTRHTGAYTRVGTGITCVCVYLWGAGLERSTGQVHGWLVGRATMCMLMNQNGYLVKPVALGGQRLQLNSWLCPQVG